ncbi:hypothetical protein ASG73_00240 [Janibacter sp. Soil728]|nr:hypothetical protein ASG73_00240 [Janibacter sp. Soil728]
MLRETLDLVEALESTQDIDQQFARMINRSLRQATRAVRLEPSAVDDATLVAISDLQGVAQILAELYPQGGER